MNLPLKNTNNSCTLNLRATADRRLHQERLDQIHCPTATLMNIPSQLELAAEKPAFVVRRGDSSESGFTILELMVVAAFVGVVMALALPTLAGSRAEAKSNEIALDIVRTVRHARSASAAYGRAHFIRFSDANDRVDVFRGLNNSCRQDWSAIVGDCAGNQMCIDTIVATDRDNGSSEYRLQSDSGDFCLCTTPTGVTSWANDCNNPRPTFSESNVSGGVNVQGGFLVNVQRFREGVEEGVRRRVLLPLGSDARLQR